VVKLLVGGLLWVACSTMGIIEGRLLVARVASSATAWVAHIEHYRALIN